ncbi:MULTISPECIES: dimethylarginine dimethylaminohydrolase family protein [Methylosinus]|uniref:arginine deiminase n=1 Tax=Methylosinus trichosporium (strain ATCC 35070 / NCIMB 11131 / UNIQEM 75 / OB3b) TaxID=595536 RepID=A0A2D2D3G1_METT3|nr:MULTISPECIES: arginine deiminase-related protein [Methylosinus]ATQ69541.1 nitrate reductase [Methylosinus trichosporium OB3b]OBS50498.1 nitrate reductase [Methylosinus sp. 3S-1]
MTKPLAMAQNSGVARRDARQRILMCAPDDFDVRYVINPWMADQIGKATRSLARAQWETLRRTLARTVDIELVTPAAGLPDMVFTANAGFTLGDTVVVSRFSAEERRAEEPLFRAHFAAQGFNLAPWPQDIAFEGAGDALIDRAQKLVWCGYGMRSDAAAPQTLEAVLERRVIGLRLIDPRFYHLDTCFCPLAGGFVMYHPPAFDAESRAAIERETPPEKRIEIGEDDASRFACNAVDLCGEIVMNDASPALQNRLRAAGFAPLLTPLGEFMKAGGSAKCLTLKLVEA